MGDRNIQDLHPELRPLCEQFLQQSKDANIDLFITFTWRSPHEQDALYAQGRTTPGAIVTNLKGESSKHCFTIDGAPAAKAFDFAIKDADGNIISRGDDPLYTQAGQIGEALGMEWGGRWHRPFDPGHLQIA